MKIYLRVIFLASISSLVFCQQKVTVDTDYNPLNQAFDNVRQIQMKYDNYKTIIYKNVSIEYEKCKETVKNMHCNNVDQWQSVIEELKQENNNSQNSEIPFLIERKNQKVQKFAKVLNQTQQDNDIFQNLTTQLSQNQQHILDAFYLIEEMYKLPKEKPDFIQLRQDDNSTEKSEDEQSSNQTASQILNSDVPDLAKEQLNIAKQAYDIADESIQAQTASNILKTLNNKMAETLSHVNESYTARSGALQMKKEQLQGDILKVRVMVQNEMNKQAQNNEKIIGLQGQIDQCSGMPTDELKDCNPIKVNASKLLTEIDIIQTRTDLLNKHLSNALEENLSEEQVKAHLQNIADAKDEKQKQAQIDSYLKDPEIQYVEPKTPNELHPIHHLKENLPEDEEAKKDEEDEEAKKDEKPNEDAAP